MTQMLAKAEGKFSETAIDDEIVVMNLDSGNFFSLTGTARAIWLLIDGTRDHDALVTALGAEYDVAPASIAGEVDDFLDQLVAADLLVRA